VIEEQILKRNKSQNWLASRLKISSGYMSQLMIGTRGPSPSLRERIVDYFDTLSFEQLFEIVDDESKS
jgi:transcriptional regulator with XRE-family HTH domain